MKNTVKFTNISQDSPVTKIIVKFVMLKTDRKTLELDFGQL